MSIADELRKWAEDNTLKDMVLTTYPPQHAVHGVLETLLRIADRIDAEHERQLEVLYRDMSDAEWVRLPLDADGVPIRVGDVMEGTCPSGKHVNGTVNAIGDGVFWLSNVQFSLKPNYMHHHHAPTVEDVLREFANQFAPEATTLSDQDFDEIISEYAAKLRLAEGEDA